MAQSSEERLALQLNEAEAANTDNNAGQGEPAAAQVSPSAAVEVSDSRPEVPPNYITLGNHDSYDPPTYDSLFGKVKKLQNDSLDRVGCRDKAYSVACTILVRLIGILLFLILPIGMLVIGILYIHECPGKKMIPIYHIVAGLTTALFFILVIMRKIYRECVKKRNAQSDGEALAADDQPENSPNDWMCDLCDGLFTLFMVAWFLAGNYYVYTTYANRPHCETFDLKCPEMMAYCNPLLLLFSFWLITGTYALCGCCTCFGICFGCITACIKR